MMEATRTRSRFAEAEDEEGWETAMPGTGVLVFHRGDNVGHDRVLVRKVGAPESRQWVVATPEHACLGGEYMGGLVEQGRHLARATAGVDLRLWGVGQFESLPRASGNRYAGESGVCPALAASGAVRLDSGVRRFLGSRPGVTQSFVVDDAEPEFMPTVADRRGEFQGGSWAVAPAIEGMEVECSCA